VAVEVGEFWKVSLRHDYMQGEAQNPQISSTAANIAGFLYRLTIDRCQ
jgi:hypothetical protein